MAEAEMTWIESRLKARRDALSRYMALKPATKGQELWRQAFVQRALTSIEARHQRVGAYNHHLAALQHILTGAAEKGGDESVAPASAEVSSRNLGDV
jgi:hypothetical protein